MNANELRRRFLAFFQEREHLILESAPLVPRDDPSTLFNSAGMQPLQPFYRGLRQPPAPRLTSCQECLRTDDLEEVGRTDRHHTFFEMLGNFAPTGGYFKERAIPWAWEFVTDTEWGLGLPVDRLRVTVHPTDSEAREIWAQRTGVKAAWIHDNDDNWWGLELGPCGPDSEVWWDRGREYGCGQEDCAPDHCGRFLEFWNLVFPSFDKQPDGSLPPLPNGPGIDTGMGLERVASILQGGESNFDTDLFAPILAFVRENGEKRDKRSERIIADHLRAATFLVAEGVLPANEGRGYVLRRLIRRADLHARRLNLSRPLAEGVPAVVGVMADQYPLLARRQADVMAAVERESQAFGRTLERGLELFEKTAARHSEVIPGEEAFTLHDTFGIPLELTREMAEERGLHVDQPGFEAAMAAQRERSRKTIVSAWADLAALPASEFLGYQQLEGDAHLIQIRRAGAEVREAEEGDEVEVYLDQTPFYAESGGQIGDTGVIHGPDGEIDVEDTRRPYQGVIAHLGRVRIGRVAVGQQVRASVDASRRRQIMRHHSATHLLNKALEEILGQGGLQRGSWVGPDHTTFDFPLDRALTQAELDTLSRRVNEQVRAALPLTVRVLPYEQAIATGATHLFDEKYGDEVRVVCFGGWSCEFCGGTHSPTSADVGPFVVLSEGSIGQGLRRLDVAAGLAAEDLIARRLADATRLAQTLGVRPDQLPERVDALRGEVRQAERQAAKLRQELRDARIGGADGSGPAQRQARVPLVLERVDAEGIEDLRGYAERYLEAIGGSGVVGVANDANFVIKVSRNLAQDYDARRLVQLMGRGGGRPELAQGKLDRPLPDAFREVEAALR
ncbi:MAG TPA: alanine--tRNA ligase [Candidatus Dormibacteraeota bacterium]|nr:alanine--tRNA ligase [Candidatus Dormibacteraeota bacterium]